MVAGPGAVPHRKNGSEPTRVEDDGNRVEKKEYSHEGENAKEDLA